MASWSSSGGYLSVSTNSMTDLVVGATFEMTIRAYSVPDSQFSDCSFSVVTEYPCNDIVIEVQQALPMGEQTYVLGESAT